MVKYGASSHKTNNIDIFPEIINLEGLLTLCMGSKVTAILLNGMDYAYWWSCMWERSALQLAQQACFLKMCKNFLFKIS